MGVSPEAGKRSPPQLTKETVMDKKRQKGAQTYKEQLENTRERMDEALDRLKTGELPEDQERRVIEKTKHREEMIRSLEDKLESSTTEEP
jgi:hypothetical protein